MRAVRIVSLTRVGFVLLIFLIIVLSPVNNTDLTKSDSANNLNRIECENTIDKENSTTYNTDLISLGNDKIVNNCINKRDNSAKKQFTKKPFYKCCPLRHFYNSTTRSCVKGTKLDIGFITSNKIRSSVYACKDGLILDYNLKDYNHTLTPSGTLVLEGESVVVFEESFFCIDKDQNRELIVRGCHQNDWDSLCNPTWAQNKNRKCVRKCCRDGQSFTNGSYYFCNNTYVHGLALDLDISTDPFDGVIPGFNCGRKLLQEDLTLATYRKSLYHLHNEGYRQHDEGVYCLEYFDEQGFKAFRCPFFDDEIEEVLSTKFLVTRWAKVLSLIFIFLTVAIYSFLPEMMNLFGKLLISYCTATFVLFLVLTYLQFDTDSISDEGCIFLGFLLLYAALASFCWLNVMCIDIWWTFGSPKSMIGGLQKRKELKRLFYYSLYGFGVPSVWILVVFLAYKITEFPSSFRAIVGEDRCLLEQRPGNYGWYVYYVAPVAVIETANIILFGKTIFYCLKVKREINRMNDCLGNNVQKSLRRRNFTADQEQMMLVLKLGVTMGLFFIFEVVSAAVSFDRHPVTAVIEIVWDTFNCLQGVFIFVIFVCKVKVYRLCRMRMCGKRRHFASSRLNSCTQAIPLTTSTKWRSDGN